MSPITELTIRPKLYFVKVDVQACFDTIEQSKLLQILRDVLSEVWYASAVFGLPSINLLQDNYVLPRFGQVMQVAGRVKRKFSMKALPDGKLMCL
jgi:telomerase reverse transcriptase